MGGDFRTFRTRRGAVISSLCLITLCFPGYGLSSSPSAASILSSFPPSFHSFLNFFKSRVKFDSQVSFGQFVVVVTLLPSAFVSFLGFLTSSITMLIFSVSYDFFFPTFTNAEICFFFLCLSVKFLSVLLFNELSYGIKSL